MSMTTRKMTTRTLLLSTAVLLAGVGVASAQGMNEGTGARGQGQAAGSISSAHGSAGGGQHVRGSSHGRSAETRHGGNGATVGAGGENHGAAQIERGRAHGNAQHNATRHEHNRTTGQATHEQTRPGRTEHNAQRPVTTRSTTGQGNPETNVAPNGRANAGPQGRVDTQAATRRGRNVRLSSQQRTRIQQSVLSRRNVPRLSRVGFALDPGVIVPDSVHYVSISDYPALVDVFPAYRDDYFFVAEDQIIVLTPQRRIVAVVPLGGGPRYGAVSAGVELSSAEIREVQQVLIDRGYDIQVDGVWGPATRRALIEFQQREGLPATGVITARTVTSLGLRGKMAESHIQRGAETTGSNVRDNTRTNVHRNRTNAQQRPNANARQNRETTGQGNQPHARKSTQPAQNRATSGQGNNQRPQNKSTNGRGGNQSTNGPNSRPQHPSTTGQGNHPKANVGRQQSGTTGMQPSGSDNHNHERMNNSQK